MGKMRPTNKWIASGAGVLAAAAMTNAAQAQTSDPLLNTLIKKGVLTQQEAEAIKTEASTNAITAAASKWKISNGIKSVELFGDLRFRYEYRGAEAVDGTGKNVGNLTRDRLRYAVRFGIRGDLLDNFYYGLRLETSANSRSPWVTFADENSFPFPGPSAKTSDGLNIGQVYLGWRPESWLDLTVGRMPNPLYITPMVWDSDITPEGLAERFKFTVAGDRVDLFANFGQFIYQDITPDHGIGGIFPGTGNNIPFLLAWQLGATYHFNKEISAKIAPVLYNYTGHGQSPNSVGFSAPFVGQGGPNGGNYPIGTTSTGSAPLLNQTGINDLLVLEVPGEINFPIGKLNGRVFGDFGYNFRGNDRATAAAAAAAAAPPPGPYPFPVQTGQNKAYQVGFGVGNNPPSAYGPTAGVVYGSVTKKGSWEARTYWQHIEQYALDVNLVDSDFFEGRGNLEGVYAALGYNISDNVIATLRGGYADRINKKLGTGGINQDLPWLNPVTRYKVLQVDLTYRF